MNASKVTQLTKAIKATKVSHKAKQVKQVKHKKLTTQAGKRAHKQIHVKENLINFEVEK